MDKVLLVQTLNDLGIKVVGNKVDKKAMMKIIEADRRDGAEISEKLEEIIEKNVLGAQKLLVEAREKFYDFSKVLNEASVEYGFMDEADELIKEAEKVGDELRNTSSRILGLSQNLYTHFSEDLYKMGKKVGVGAVASSDDVEINVDGQFWTGTGVSDEAPEAKICKSEEEAEKEATKAQKKYPDAEIELVYNAGMNNERIEQF